MKRPFLPFQELDRALDTIAREVTPLRYLTPVNGEAEKQIFLADDSYSP